MAISSSRRLTTAAAALALVLSAEVSSAAPAKPQTMAEKYTHAVYCYNFFSIAAHSDKPGDLSVNEGLADTADQFAVIEEILAKQLGKSAVQMRKDDDHASDELVQSDAVWKRYSYECVYDAGKRGWKYQ